MVLYLCRYRIFPGALVPFYYSATIAGDLVPVSSITPNLLNISEGDPWSFTVSHTSGDAPVTCVFERSNDGGTTWFVSPTSGVATAADVANSPLMFRYVCTDNDGDMDTATALIYLDVCCANPESFQHNVGAGGFIMEIEQANDGTMVIAPDTTSPLKLPVNATRWEQLTTSDSMPAGSWTPGVGVGGTYTMAIAPSNSNIIYKSVNGSLYRSVDGGATFTTTSLTGIKTAGNADPRQYGDHMAVHPTNPNIVVYGGQEEGLWVATDGQNFTQIANVPPSGNFSNAGNGSQSPGITGVVFDPSDPTRVYACSVGTGVFRSTNSGATWSLIPGSPVAVRHSTVGIDGTFYCTHTGLTTGAWNPNNWNDNPSSVWRLDGTSTWTQITPPFNTSQMWHIDADPFDANRLLHVRGSGEVQISTDKGATWGPRFIPFDFARNEPGYAINHNPKVTLNATGDIPWLDYTREARYLSTADARWDRSTPDRFWIAQGIGMWYADLDASNAFTEYRALSAGIEQLVSTQVISIGGGDFALGAWDRGLFKTAIGGGFVNEHFVNGRFDDCWAVAQSPFDPNYIAASFSLTDGTEGNTNFWSGYSTDKITTQANWTTFPTKPLGATNGDDFGYGQIAVSQPGNIVWAGAYHRGYFYTTDSGVTWNACAGITGNYASFGGNYFFYNYVLVADPVTPGTFYTHTKDGVWRSIDQGANWTKQANALEVNNNFHNKLKAVPGYSGHLSFSIGDRDGPFSGEPMFYSDDAGVSWTTITAVNYAKTHCWGAECPAAQTGYPTLWVYGFVNNSYGLHMSTDKGATFTQVDDYLDDSLDNIRDMDADNDIFGRIVVGTTGQGWKEFTCD